MPGLKAVRSMSLVLFFAPILIFPEELPDDAVDNRRVFHTHEADVLQNGERLVADERNNCPCAEDPVQPRHQVKPIGNNHDKQHSSLPT